jgi:deoxycytidylate deaminase
MLEMVIKFLKNSNWLSPAKTARDISQLIDLTIGGDEPIIPKSSQMRNLLEFGRAVHPEMAALTDAARRGVSVAGCTMYVTTFPCHLCARHVVAAGIRKVIYIEPYAKSRTASLYPDSVAIEGESSGKV